MQVHVVPTHSEEDGEEGKEEPKDHSSRTADFSCVLGSQSLTINHTTPPPYHEALWKGCMKDDFTESNQQILVSAVCQTLFELWLEQGAMVRWGQNGIYLGKHVHPSASLASKEGYIQGNAPHTYHQIWWRIIYVLGCFAASGPRAL